MDENKIIPYIEPIFRFCCKRLSNRYDAEELASEIICHILDGMNKYQIESLDAWVWRIAHNRYARFIDSRNKNQTVLSCEDELFDIADYSDTDEKINDLLAEWILSVRKIFEGFVPKHLHDQINQWVSCYLYQIIGYVTDELICRGILRKPDFEKPLTNGVFCVEGKYINP